MSYRDHFDIAEENRIEEDAARERAIAKGDWCPVCGFSESEHSSAQAEACLESFYAGEMLMHRMRGAP